MVLLMKYTDKQFIDAFAVWMMTEFFPFCLNCGAVIPLI